MKYRYSRWDGSQTGFELDAEQVLAEVADDLLYHGDLNAALRRALQNGMRAPDGRALDGLRQLLERIARRRREELERHELSGLTADIASRSPIGRACTALDRAIDDVVTSSAIVARA